jgi:hypothetical protein
VQHFLVNLKIAHRDKELGRVGLRRYVRKEVAVHPRDNARNVPAIDDVAHCRWFLFGLGFGFLRGFVCFVLRVVECKENEKKKKGETFDLYDISFVSRKIFFFSPNP